MKSSACLVLLLTGVSPGSGPSGAEARTGSASNVTRPQFRLVRIEGTTLLITESEQAGDLHIVTDTDDNRPSGEPPGIAGAAGRPVCRRRLTPRGGATGAGRALG